MPSKERTEAKKKYHREYYRQWRIDNPEKCQEYTRKSQLKRYYNLTPEQFDEMLEYQGGACKICKSTKPGGRWDRFFVDHCHTTNKVRGLLCVKCNRGIGNFDDNPDFLRSAAEYLEETK